MASRISITRITPNSAILSNNNKPPHDPNSLNKAQNKRSLDTAQVLINFNFKIVNINLNLNLHP